MPAISRASSAPAFDDLSGFARVVELGSFAKAARELRLPTSTLSRAVQRLESAMGVRLLQRTTRTLRLTEEGSELHRRIAPALVAIRDAVRDVEAHERHPRGRLRVTAPTDIAITFIADVIAEFTRRYPEVEVELTVTQRVVDLVGEGFDVAVRAGILRDSTLIARRLGSAAGGLYASPAYVRRRGEPKTPAELSRHELVAFRPSHGVARWMLRSGAKQVEVEPPARVACDDFSFVRAALLSGAGIGLLPGLVAARDVAEGRLTRVLDGWSEELGAFHLVYPSSRHVPAKLAVFRDFLVERYSAYTAADLPRRRHSR